MLVTGCAATAPCRTLAGAYAVTSAGGEIVALDSAGYGALTITNSITIVGSQPASVSVAASGTGITINAGSGHVVILRGLEINGANASNTTGIAVNSGRPVLQNSTLKFLTTGLSVGSANVDVIDSQIIGNTTGITATGTGASASGYPTSAATTTVRLARGDVLDNGTAFNQINTGSNNASIWLLVTSNSSASISTNIAGNATVVSSSGTGCPCSAVGVYIQGVNFNFP